MDIKLDCYKESDTIEYDFEFIDSDMDYYYIRVTQADDIWNGPALYGYIRNKKLNTTPND